MYSARAMYTSLLHRFLLVATDLRREAVDRESQLRITYPEWEPPEGEGPLAEWEGTFLTSGYITENAGHFVVALPPRPEDVYLSTTCQESLYTPRKIQGAG